jgi:hypothetical protein
VLLGGYFGCKMLPGSCFELFRLFLVGMLGLCMGSHDEALRGSS